MRTKSQKARTKKSSLVYTYHIKYVRLDHSVVAIKSSIYAGPRLRPLLIAYTRNGRAIRFNAANIRRR
jgi:hypothetical protein